jgi:short-subunit dehydrogenase
VRRLDGQQVVLTGAAGGLGSLVAAGLRSRGSHVLGIDRVECPACDESLVADLADRDGLAALSATLKEHRVDILVNIAGLQYFGPFERQEADNIALGYAVNLVAPAILSRAVLSGMKQRGSGQIVNVGSVMGAINYPYFASYSSAKAGLRGLSQALRRELHGRGIAITYIAPRAVNTAFNSKAVNRFLELAKMRADDPGVVAGRIVEAIAGRAKDVSIGVPEKFYCALNALFPRVVDAGLAGQTLKARQLFN